MRKSRKIPPSKIKYQKSHPTISARLPKEQHDKLLALLQSMDMTLPQLLLSFIGEYEIKIMPIEEARQKGFKEAKEIYMVTFLCRKCRKPIAINSKQAKEAAGNYMAEHGWGHKECAEKRNL